MNFYLPRRHLPVQKNLKHLTSTKQNRTTVRIWIAILFLMIGSPSQVSAAMQFVEAQYGGPVLDGAYGIAASPDGAHIYAAGYNSGVIAHFERNASTGILTLSEIFRDGVDGVDGIDSVMDVVVSPDGRSVYAVGEWDNGLAVFSRDTTTGLLVFVEEVKEGVNGVDGLEGAVGVVVSPDNRHVYVAGSFEDSVTVFSRDATTSALTFVAVYNDSVGGVEGIAGASAITFSPDGNHLYVAGYFGNSLAVFSRDSISGKLTFLEAFYDDTDGVDGLDGIYSLIMSADGSHLYTAGLFDDAVALFSRDNATGRLTFVQACFDGTNGINGLAGAIDIAISPDDNHLYVAGWFDDALVVFTRNSINGALSYVETQQEDINGVEGLYGANSVVVTPDGAHIYVSGEYDNALAVFERNSSTGQTSFVEKAYEHYTEADGLYSVVNVTVSPDGKHVYTAAYGDDSVAVFSRNSSTGALNFVENHKDGINGVDGLSRAFTVVVSPDGLHLYAAGYGSDTVVLFERDSATGRLTFMEMQKDGVDGVDGLDGPQALAVSPDGKHVYVAGYLEDAVAVFARNSTTGALTFSQVVRDNTDGVDGLDGVRALTVSADGLHLYAASRSDSSVAVFSRNSETGELAFVENQRDGTNGVDGLHGARAVALSADGSHLYAAGHYDSALAVFSRNAITGGLTFVEMVKDEINDVEGLFGSCAVAVSPDGEHLYAAGYYDNAAVAFTRDSVTGQLTFEEVKQDGVDGVDGLSAIYSLAVSPDGYHLYTVGYHDSAIAVFQVRTPEDPGTDTVTIAPNSGGGGCFLSSL